MDKSAALNAVAESGIDYRIIRFEPARDLTEAAERRGTTVDRILKTMVVRTGEDTYVIVLVPGDRVIDWAALRDHLGLRRLALADADQAYAATGYRRGTITPFGVLPVLPVVVDAGVVGKGEVSVGAGVPGTAVHLDVDDLIDTVGAVPAHITKPAEEPR
ncbi:MAG: YbaK/EbsC family protein [Actinomycetota bacterium]|nr:YbaK/EbsC family protein [Actinomycetota bacterium]